jgi:hypothetical protein
MLYSKIGGKTVLEQFTRQAGNTYCVIEEAGLFDDLLTPRKKWYWRLAAMPDQLSSTSLNSSLPFLAYILMVLLQ